MIGDLVATPAGPIFRRPERDDDAPFLSALFAAGRAAIFEGAGLPPDLMDGLIAMQYRAQTASYSAMFVGARRDVLAQGATPIGRIMTHDESDAVYVVDIALLPSVQGRGIGAAIVRTVMDDAAAIGRGVRAVVLVSNLPSLAVFRRLGFAATGEGDVASIELIWRPTRVVVPQRA